jgi:hypothetical protein
LPKGWFRGPFETEFESTSVDGFTMVVRVDGRWRRRSLWQHDPESAAASYVIDEISHLTVSRSVLAASALERMANARLGRPANVRSLGIRVRWAHVHIDVDPEVQSEAQNRMRLLARAKADREDKQLRMAQAVALRDLLRKDPTLALAYLLLESPEKIDSHAISRTIKTVGEQIAAYAPGAAWIKTAQLLEKSFGELAPDAKQAIINRICRTLTEFGEKEAARHIEQTHGLAPLESTVDGSRNSHENLQSDQVTL